MRRYDAARHRIRVREGLVCIPRYGQFVDDVDDGINSQRVLWRSQAGAIPGLLGGKSAWAALLPELIEQIGDGRAVDLDSRVTLSFDLAAIEPRSGGAQRQVQPATWREYYGFLRGLGFATSAGDGLRLTEIGERAREHPTSEVLAGIFADRIRLFAEILAIVGEGPMTVDEVHDCAQGRFGPSWRSNANTRIRMDWQEVLGLIESAGNRKWRVTVTGDIFLAGRLLVTPEALGGDEAKEVTIMPATAGVSACLEELTTSTRTHSSRSTYNIWVPSPATSPNKVENLRTIMAATLDPIKREDLFEFICERFELKRSSVDSMLPFLRASGLLVEVSRGVYEATPVAREWVDSGEDINFIRILHAHMRFVGEMIRCVQADATRSDMYAEAATYGLNVDKCRWIAGFLLNTGLVEEPRYGSLRATPRGRALLEELPLAEATQVAASDVEASSTHADAASVESLPELAQDLVRLAKDPSASGLQSGRAFEAAVSNAFAAMGFGSRVISGSGDTDVLVEWVDQEGELRTAIVEAKARTSGLVTHTDVSDVAIETHKSLHAAEGVAVVAPGFSGRTIADMAEKKGWSLIEAGRLGELAEGAIAVGLRPCDIAILFATPNGVTDLEDLIAARQRELKIVSFLVRKLAEEQGVEGEAISARDISRDGRRTQLAPSVDEVVAAVETLVRLQVEIPRLIDSASDPRFSAYVLGDSRSAVRQLRALADAIEGGAN